MSTGTLIFLIALAIILAFGATMIWQTFHDTDRRRGSYNDEDAIEREVGQNRPHRRDTESDDDGNLREVRENRPSHRGFDVDDDIKPKGHETPRHGRHEFR